jgi:hypothetical protein
LETFLIWLQKWKSLPNGVRLSRDTFDALERSTKALIMITNFVLTHLSVKYVLPGKFQTHNLELRFSRYRSLSSCNYHISFRQILESEKQIRTKRIFDSIKTKNLVLKEFKDTCTLQENTDDLLPFKGIFDASYLTECEIDASSNNIPNTFNKVKKLAGKDWYYAFLKRNPTVAKRKHQS